MIYTTGGMRVARVSVVDAAGKEVLDEIVRMDEGVEVMCVASWILLAYQTALTIEFHRDYNTRFSGITAENHATATLTLASVRKALAAIINSETIVIGHALDNDLKTLRMIHHRCVDTVDLFPHTAGPPYRRALRTLLVCPLFTNIYGTDLCTEPGRSLARQSRRQGLPDTAQLKTRLRLWILFDGTS